MFPFWLPSHWHINKTTKLGSDGVIRERVEPFRCYGRPDLVVVYKWIASSHSEVQDIKNPGPKTRQRGIPAEHPPRSPCDDESLA